jgi:MFS superfamily sulfate permease-like transporter
MGLATAIYGPLIGGLIGGSNYNILGPAGALVNILNKLSFDNGIKILPYIAIGSGILSLFILLFKLE